MPTICVLSALVIVFLAAYAIVKKAEVRIVLLLAGLALNILALVFGADNILPRNGRATGFAGFDLFEAVRAVSHSQLGGAGFIILLAGGFAAYMDKIGASGKLVDLAMKPLAKIRHPYFILVTVFVIGHLLSTVVTSAAGLAMLLAVTVFPLLTALGISAVSVAAVLGSAVMFSWAPTSSLALLGAELAQIDPMEYLIQHQLPVGIPIVLTMTVAHYFTQKYFDARDRASGRFAAFDVTNLEHAQQKDTRDVPAFYALLPVVPIVLLLTFNKMVWGSIVLDVSTAMIIGWVVGLVVDLLVRRQTSNVFRDATAMFDGMGNMLNKVVTLIFVAALFALGLANTGVVGALIEASRSMGLGLEGTGLVVSGAISVITLLTGSGVAAFTSLVPLSPELATALGGNAASLSVMMQCGAEIVRAMSPVAGVVIIVAGFAGTNPFEVVRRTTIPTVAGYVVGLAASSFLL